MKQPQIWRKGNMFDKYPYTNFHEMNLDWIIKEMKDLVDSWNSFSGNVTATAHESSEPEVNVSGDLKTSLDFDFGLVRGPRGATGAQGPQGAQGPAGEGLQILDTYPTLAALQSAHPTGSAGDAYLVGSGGVYTLYIWSTSNEAWANAGSLTSPSPSSTAPLMDGVAAAGSSSLYARGDHVHPSDTSKLDKASTDGVYAVAGGAQDMLAYSENSLADALVQYDAVGDINTRNLTATGSVNANSISVTNNTILNSAMLAAEVDGTNAYKPIARINNIDPLAINYDENEVPSIRMNTVEYAKDGSRNNVQPEVFFTDSFGINQLDYAQTRIALAPATSSRLGGIIPGTGLGIDSNGVLYNANMYRAGDTLSLSAVHCVGVLTGTRNLVRYFLPLSKPIASNTNIRVTSMTITVRGIAGSIFESVDVSSTSGYNISNSSIRENGIYFQITLDTPATSTTNSTPLDIQIENLIINFIA